MGLTVVIKWQFLHWYLHHHHHFFIKTCDIPHSVYNKKLKVNVAVFQPQSIGEILLLSLKNKRPPYENSTFGFDFELFVVIGMWFCTGSPNFVRIGRSATDLWRYADFQDGGQTVANLLPVSGFMTWEGKKLLAYQISTRYPNARLIYYYFRLLKTNVRHIEILLPVSIWHLHRHRMWFCTDLINLYELIEQRQSYYVISIFQDGGHTVANLLPFSGVVTSHVSEGTKLFAY